MNRRTEQGSVLLGVLWLVAALSLISLSLAITVRGEAERSGTYSETTQAYYLASGGVDRGLLRILWKNIYGANTYKPSISRYQLNFPEGIANIEIVPENSKLDLNKAEPKQLLILLRALGAPAPQAQAIVEGIVDWRSPVGPNVLTPFDAYYGAQQPSFRARHASFEEVEELLAIRGMTPELFYGSYVRDADGNLHALGGLRDCLSTYTPNTQKDINAVEPAVLLALGAPPDGVQVVMNRRAQGPIDEKALGALRPALGSAGGQVGIGGNSIFTLRSTGRPRLPNGQLSDASRTVAAMFKMMKPGIEPPVQVLRWWDQAWVNGDTVR